MASSFPPKFPIPHERQNKLLDTTRPHVVHPDWMDRLRGKQVRMTFRSLYLRFFFFPLSLSLLFILFVHLRNPKRVTGIFWGYGVPGFWECLLKLLNFLLTLAGLAMVGYGIYLFVEWRRSLEDLNVIVGQSSEILTLGRPLLMSVPLSASILDKLPKAWFIYLFIGIGVILFIISVIGCIGLATRHGCCLSCYSVLVLLLILVEVGFAAFIFFDHSWEDAIPTDSTGDFDMIYAFLKENWKIAKWVALGVVILEVLTFLLAFVVRAANSPNYDSDDEYMYPRPGIRQPFIGRQGVPATGVPVAGGPDQRIGRNDAWSTRMREKYGLDTSEFTYKSSDSNRYQQQIAPPTEERSRCTIM